MIKIFVCKNSCHVFRSLIINSKTISRQILQQPYLFISRYSFPVFFWLCYEIIFSFFAVHWRPLFKSWHAIEVKRKLKRCCKQKKPFMRSLKDQMWWKSTMKKKNWQRENHQWKSWRKMIQKVRATMKLIHILQETLQ